MTQLQIVGLSLLVTVVYMTCGWIISVIRRDASTVDPFWGLGFVLLAVVLPSPAMASSAERRSSPPWSGSGAFVSPATS